MKEQDIWEVGQEGQQASEEIVADVPGNRCRNEEEEGGRGAEMGVRSNDMQRWREKQCGRKNAVGSGQGEARLNSRA